MIHYGVCDEIEENLDAKETQCTPNLPSKLVHTWFDAATRGDVSVVDEHL